MSETTAGPGARAPAAALHGVVPPAGHDAV